MTEPESSKVEFAPSPQYHEIIRAMIQHENDLINVRMGWMNVLQGLLFTTLGLIIQTGINELYKIFIVIIISVLGFCISRLIIRGLISASKAIRELLEWWESHKPYGYNGPDVIGLRPSQQDTPGRCFNIMSVMSSFWDKDLENKYHQTAWSITNLFSIGWFVIGIIFIYKLICN